MKYVVTINAKNDKLSIKEYQDYIQIDLNYLYPLKRESLTKSLDTLFGTG